MKIITRLICILFIGIFAMTRCKNHSIKKTYSDTFQSEVMLKLFNFKTSNDLIVKIPEINVDCRIIEIINNDSTHFAKGSYAKDEEKGIVFIDYLKILALNHSSENLIYFIMPFDVSNQGSAVFKYIGLFILNSKEITIKHIDSKFLGDRIKLETLEYDGNKLVHVKMKVHSKEQSMSSSPSETNEIDFIFEKGELHHNLD